MHGHVREACFSSIVIMQIVAREPLCLLKLDCAPLYCATLLVCMLSLRDFECVVAIIAISSFACVSVIRIAGFVAAIVLTCWCLARALGSCGNWEILNSL